MNDEGQKEKEGDKYSTDAGNIQITQPNEGTTKRGTAIKLKEGLSICNTKRLP